MFTHFELFPFFLKNTDKLIKLLKLQLTNVKAPIEIMMKHCSDFHSTLPHIFKVSNNAYQR